MKLNSKLFRIINFITINMLLVMLVFTCVYAAPATISNPFSGGVQAHGGGVIKVGSTYYWFGENRNTDNSFNAVSCYSSTDLKNWTFRNNCLTRTSNADLNSANIERPKVIYCPTTGKYVMWMHKETATDYNQARAAVATCSTVDGNYTYLGSFQPLNNMSRDCTLFEDGGTAYFISAANNNADLHIYRLTSDYQSIGSLVQKLFVGQSREAPCMFKRNGYYFLITSGCTGWSPNQQKYSYATNIAGTWSGLQNIGDGTCYNTQGTFVLPVSGSSTTSYLFMGDRWAPAWAGKVNDSVYVWMPLSFSSNTSMSLNYADTVTVDTATGTISGATVTYNTVKNKKSGKLMDVNNGNTANGVAIIQWTGNGGFNQKWQKIDAGGGYYKFRNKQSGKVLDVSGASTADGAAIIQYDDNGGDNQLWQLISDGSGYYKIKNKKSGKLLDVKDQSTADGGILIQWPDNNGDNQKWQLL